MRFIWIVVALLFLGGCRGRDGSDTPYQPSRYSPTGSDASFVEKIRPGMTQREVVEAVGQPTVISIENSSVKGEFSWDYIHVSGPEDKPKLRAVAVFFEDYKVKKVLAVSP